MNERTYPDKLEVKPLERPPVATVRVPGSKSITNRVLVLAAIASKGLVTDLHGVLLSEDTEVMMSCLRQLGFLLSVETEGADTVVWIGSESDLLPITAKNCDLFVANSGTTMRFLTALIGVLGCGRYRLDGVPRMRE